MIDIAVLGCGRIGRMHCQNIHDSQNFRLAAIYDIDPDAASAMSTRFGARVAGSVEEVLGDTSLRAILVATFTSSHAQLIEAGVKAGKAVFCEKPVDLDLGRAIRCKMAIEDYQPLVQIGFNRRFDPGHAAARSQFQTGTIGELYQILITSRDPSPPPRSYVQGCGGLFRDMSIHDFDMARYLLDEEPVEIFSMAQALIDKDLEADLGDFDTAMVLLRTANGRQCCINNSRQALYGYDQRIEILGEKGMIQSGNRKPHETTTYTAHSSENASPYLHFFIERYYESFALQLEAFAETIEDLQPRGATLEDGIKALQLAEAANLSLTERRLVHIDEVVC